MMPPGSNNQDLEQSLADLPDKVADALKDWRIATLERERCEALLYAEFKGQDKERTATEIKALIHASNNRYQSVMREIKAESEYNRLYERLMALKKRCYLRTAY